MIIPALTPVAVIEKEMFELFSKTVELTSAFPNIPAALCATADVI